MNFDFKDSRGAVVCSLRLLHLWADVYGLLLKADQGNFNVEHWQNLFTQAIDVAKGKGARQIILRLTDGDQSEDLIKGLIELGFNKKQDRIEFRRKLSDLPSSEGTPIQWMTAHDLEFTEAQIADFLSVVAEGDPDPEPTNDPLSHIQDWISDPVLTCGPKCIAIGLIQGEPCAFVVAQVDIQTKWSRISYMGVMPKFRGRGLGAWVHRHGFDMMRAQGGDLYHGGTSGDNLPMLSLFERHGCEVHCKMQEWVLAMEKGGGDETVKI